MPPPASGSQARLTLPCPRADAVNAATINTAKRCARPMGQNSLPIAALIRWDWNWRPGRDARAWEVELPLHGSFAAVRIIVGSEQSFIQVNFTRRESLARRGHSEG